jgi:hypothetical protein
MTVLVQELLNSFDLLTDSEQLDLTVEILNRTSHLELPPLSDESLALSAEELLLELDKQEVDRE